LKFDTYLAPWATVEQALLRVKMGEYAEASDLLDCAKYVTKSLVNFYTISNVYN